jgi:uncharacterized protein
LHLARCEPGVHLLDLKEDASVFGFPEGDVRVQGPVTLALRVTRDGATVVVAGRIDAVASQLCDRCLAPLTERVSVDVREVYHVIDGPLAMDEEDGEERHFISSRTARIDLAPAIRELILLDLPMRNLCSASCRGLCPTCGANLNAGLCACGGGPGDARWAALRALRGGAGGADE